MTGTVQYSSYGAALMCNSLINSSMSEISQLEMFPKISGVVLSITVSKAVVLEILSNSIDLSVSVPYTRWTGTVSSGWLQENSKNGRETNSATSWVLPDLPVFWVWFNLPLDAGIVWGFPLFLHRTCVAMFRPSRAHQLWFD